MHCLFYGTIHGMETHALTFIVPNMSCFITFYLFLPQRLFDLDRKRHLCLALVCHLLHGSFIQDLSVDAVAHAPPLRHGWWRGVHCPGPYLSELPQISLDHIER